MFHVMFNQADTYDVAVLCKTEALDKNALEQHYINPLKALGVTSNFIGFSLEYDNAKKVKASFAKDYLAELLPELRELGVKTLYCTDGNYFKVLTKQTKAEPHYGYVVPCAIKGYEDMQVVLSVNHRALFMNETLQSKIDLANNTLANYLAGSYQEIGKDIIKYSEYIPCELTKIKEALDRLLDYEALTCDIEAFSLRHTSAGIGTIGFAWNENEGICIDISHNLSSMGYLSSAITKQAKALLRDFFENYKGKLIFHNCTYDIKVLIYELWMDDLIDTKGLITGLQYLTRDFEDTKIISYLALNSCAGNKLSLKEQAHEFAGNYAESDIDDIRKIPNKNLMKYNLIDCLSTWYVFNKNYPKMVKDEQLDIYQTLFKPALINIIQMELTGMPLNMERVKEVDQILKDIIDENTKILNDSPLMKQFSAIMRDQIRDKKNAGYKQKVITSADVDYTFNTDSPKQLISLIHEFFGFDVYSTTETGQPAVGGDEIKGHIERTNDQSIKEVLNAILKIQEGNKIRNTFVSKFLDADAGPDGWHYLFGSFNLGGTKSGRLSSSNPNL